MIEMSIYSCPKCGSTRGEMFTGGYSCPDCNGLGSRQFPQFIYPEISYQYQVTPPTGIKECDRCGDPIPASRKSNFCRLCRIELYDKSLPPEINQQAR